ncbi:MAG: hypothetical protein M1370_08205 [Bacteroidetes bacterium]|nr:hypothetical protein [Bacteroidota bacterium]MCL5027357.1 hypothetical protein [Chloroflexota bacterium]
MDGQAFLVDVYSLGALVGWIALFKALWLGPLVGANIYLLHLQISYLETYRATFNSRLPLSWGELVARRFRGQPPSRAELAEVDWSGWQDACALFTPGVGPELEVLRRRIFHTIAGMLGWFLLPFVAAAWSALAG